MRILFILTGAVFLASCDSVIDVPEEILLPLEQLMSGPITFSPDPTGIAPLTGFLYFETKVPVLVEATIAGDIPVKRNYNTPDTIFAIPILGLYPGIENKLYVRIFNPEEGYALDTVYVTTPPLPAFFPTVEIRSSNENRMEEGWTLSSFSIGNNGVFLSYPFMFDSKGAIRWYLDLSSFHDLIFLVEQLNNGNLIFGQGRSLYEYDRLGIEINRWNFPEYWFHHEVIEKPDGNLVVAVDKDGLNTTEDHIIEIDRTTGVVVREWDLRQVLDVYRRDYIPDDKDWFHMNGLWYDTRDGSLIVSGRNQGVVKISRTNQLVWILAPHKGWGKSGINKDGYETSEYLLTAVYTSGTPYSESIQMGLEDALDFSWVWGQHAPELLPNGNLFIFDNGYTRNFSTTTPTFSRGVEYAIDEASMTLKQVWQYGAELGIEFYSSIISDVDYLPITGNRLIMPGIVTSPSSNARVTEVTENKQVVFDAIIHLKNLLSSGAVGWGQTDLVYRSERVPLYPNDGI